MKSESALHPITVVKINITRKIIELYDLCHIMNNIDLDVWLILEESQDHRVWPVGLAGFTNHAMQLITHFKKYREKQQPLFSEAHSTSTIEPYLFMFTCVLFSFPALVICVFCIQVS